MPTPASNPCASCSIAQDCCTRLAGLRVTHDEYERCFASAADQLEIVREGPLYVLTPRHGAACPNWRDGGCAVYEMRPRECRLFPFTLFVRRPKDDVVSLGYHSDTCCPLKTQLLPPDAEARRIVASFGAEAFPAATVRASPETYWERLLRKTRDVVRRWLGPIR